MKNGQIVEEPFDRHFLFHFAPYRRLYRASCHYNTIVERAPTRLGSQWAREVRVQSDKRTREMAASLLHTNMAFTAF